MLRQNDISAETTAVSKWHFVLMALMDTCAMLLTVIPGGRVPAPLTVLLLQVRRVRVASACTHTGSFC